MRLTRFAPSVVSGVLLGLAFPSANLTFLAWIALVPLFASLTPRGPNETRPPVFMEGFVAFFIADLIIFFWLWPTFTAARINFVTTLACWLALSAIVALYGGVLALVYRSVPSERWRPWVTAAAWVALEEVRSVALTGFPWALLAHTQARHAPLIQIASVTGAAGVSFLIMAFNAALAQAAAAALAGRRAPGPYRVAAVAFALVLANAVGGQVRLVRSKPTADARWVNIAVLQGNIDQYRKWDDAYEADIRKTYERLVSQTKTERLDLIVWPETAVPGWIPKDPFYASWVANVAKESNTPHLVGALAESDEGEFNAAFLVKADGAFAQQYNKQHLVPFGEYIPFGGFLKGVIPYLGQLGTFDAGASFVLFDVGTFKAAPNICYEMMFPALVRVSARSADVIVNITNDGWFLDSGAPEQHFSVNFFRAVENGRPVVRAANTGISAFIDAQGRLLRESPLLATGVFFGRIPLAPDGAQTPFGRWGNWFGWLCGAVAVGAVARILWRAPSSAAAV